MCSLVFVFNSEIDSLIQARAMSSSGESTEDNPMPIKIENALLLHKDKLLLVDRTRKTCVCRTPVTDLPSSPTSTKEEMFGRNSRPECPATADLVDDFHPPNHPIHQKMVPVKYGTPGGGRDSDTSKPGEEELGLKRKEYYDHVFALREPPTSSQNRVAVESIVAIDIRTNVVVSLCTLIL